MMHTAKTILITGGTGFVGRSVAEALVQRGHKVFVLSRHPFPPAEQPTATHSIQGDLLALDVADLRAIIQENSVDIVVHCAGELNNESRMRPLHVDATGRLALASRGVISHWVQMSSVGALGAHVVGEVSPDRRTPPMGLYETTKAESDSLVSETLRGSRTSLTILMPTIVFGPSMSSTALRRLVNAVRSGRFIHVGPQDAGAHYLFINDLAAATVNAAEGQAPGTYVISDSTTVGAFVDAIAAETGVATPRRRIPEPLMRALQSSVTNQLRIPGINAVRALRSQATYSSQPATKDLGWAPSTGWRAGLAQCISAWSAEGTTANSPEAEAMRIAYLTTVPMTLHFFRGHIRHEQAAGSTVTVITDPAGGTLQKMAAELGASHAGIRMSRDISLARDIRALASLVRVLREVRPHVLQTATPKAALLGAIAGRLARVPIIVTGVFGLPQMTTTGWRRSLLDATTRISTYLSDLTWCDSPSMAQYVRAARLAPKHRVVVVGQGSVSGVDAAVSFNPDTLAEHGARIRGSLQIGEQASVIGFVGRLAHDKGMTELAEAWTILRERHPTAHLVIVGPDDGDLKGAARQLLQADERQHWVGPRSSVGEWYAAMDVFVMPSYREGFCATNIEASAMRLPVVATRIPGCVDSVLDGITGTLIPVRDSAGLADAVSEYLWNSGLRSQHGQAGRTRAIKDFTPERLEAELGALYREEYRAKLGHLPTIP